MLALSSSQSSEEPEKDRIDEKKRVESRVTPRFRTIVEGIIGIPSI